MRLSFAPYRQEAGVRPSSDGGRDLELGQLLRGLYLLHSDRPALAVDVLRPLLHNQAAPAPPSLVGLQTLVEACMAAGQLSEADKVVRNTLSLYPDDPKLHLLAGELALAASDYGRATRHLRYAMQSDLWPSAVVPYVGALLWQAQKTEAVTVVMQSMRDAPADAALCTALAAILEDHALWRSALTAYHRGRVQRPDDASAALGEARVALRLGDTHSAAAALRSLSPLDHRGAQAKALRNDLKRQLAHQAMSATTSSQSF